jgi:hypothetical protein
MKNMNNTTRILVLVLSCAASRPAPAESPAAPPLKASLAELAWMAGDWQMSDGDAAVEEHWMAPKGGLMLGIGRTVKGGRAVEFEFLRIEQKGDGLVYLASPGGRPATPFPLVERGETSAVFESALEFPRRVSYRKNSDGSLTARIEGTRDGKPASKEWTWRRAAP